MQIPGKMQIESTFNVTVQDVQSIHGECRQFKAVFWLRDPMICKFMSVFVQMLRLKMKMIWKNESLQNARNK